MFCAIESKTVNCVDQHVAAVANQRSEHDVTVATSSDDVIHTSQVTSSTDKCQQLRAPASLPLWIYCTRYTDRPPGRHYIRNNPVAFCSSCTQGDSDVKFFIPYLCSPWCGATRASSETCLFCDIIFCSKIVIIRTFS